MPVTFDSRSPLQNAAPAVSAAETATSLLQRASGVFSSESGDESTRCLTRAAGRLDLMGGIAEYTGSLVLGFPSSAGVSVAAEARDDRSVVVYDLASARESGEAPFVFDLPLLESDGSVAHPAAVIAQFDKSASDVVKAVVGSVYAMRTSGKIDDSRLGATVVVDSEIPASVDLAPAAATAVASITALCSVWNVDLDPLECAVLATRAKNEIVGVPCGMSSAVCALHGRTGLVTQFNCASNQVLAPLTLPKDVTIVGIDCGSKHEDAREKYVRARVATFMGRRFVQQIFETRNRGDETWNNWLSQLTPDEYVERLRDRIPTKIRGSDFLQRFGETADPLTVVDPGAVYKIRSRTEHHIYEADRTRRFAEHLIRAARTGDRKAVIEAGELMHASHWSYGQRCGLGSVATDRLVNITRKRGPDAGLFGAKVSARGAGGVVVALIADDDTGRSSLREVIDEYERDTSLTTQLLCGSSPGALEFGVHRS